MFDEVIISEDVYREVTLKFSTQEATDVKNAIEVGKWIKVKKSQKLEGIIGAGESTSIKLALKFNQPLIIDDKKAAIIGKSMGIECHGTLYVVWLSLKIGILKNKKEAIEIVNQLISNNLYVRSDVLSEFYELLNKINIK